MIVQSASIILKQRNQPNRECLYAWYPEVVMSTPMDPRDIYIHKGIDKDLIQQSSSSSSVNGFINTSGNDQNVLQRYKQSIAPSERDYHSPETLDEALKTPWALHYEILRRPATPNFPSNSTDISRSEEIPRRLKSAPAVRSLPPTTVLTIPEPRFITSVIPVPNNQLVETSSITRPKTRASSAKARLNTTFPIANEQINDDWKQQRREIKSAQGIRQKEETKFLNEDHQKTTIQGYNDIVQQQDPSSTPPTPPPLPPGYVYQRSSSRSSSEPPLSIKRLRSTAEINPVPLNPYYVRRPGVIAVKNTDKKPVIRESSASRKSARHHRKHHHHHHHHHHRLENRNEPLLAVTPISRSTKDPFELDGIKLIYDPTLIIDDPSLNLTRYVIEGCLYLIKDQRYNVFENIDPTYIEKFNQTSILPQRPKYYQTIPIEKFQLSKPPAEVHYNASETYFYNTLPKRHHRYVIDPHFISENLNVNKISLSKRPATAAVVHATLTDLNRRQVLPSTVYS